MSRQVFPTALWTEGKPTWLPGRRGPPAQRGQPRPRGPMPREGAGGPSVADPRRPRAAGGGPGRRASGQSVGAGGSEGRAKVQPRCGPHPAPRVPLPKAGPAAAAGPGPGAAGGPGRRPRPGAGTPPHRALCPAAPASRQPGQAGRPSPGPRHAARTHPSPTTTHLMACMGAGRAGAGPGSCGEMPAPQRPRTRAERRAERPETAEHRRAPGAETAERDRRGARVFRRMGAGAGHGAPSPACAGTRVSPPVSGSGRGPARRAPRSRATPAPGQPGPRSPPARTCVGPPRARGCGQGDLSRAPPSGGGTR